MTQSKILNPFYDIGSKGLRQTQFFFLEHILKARADLKLESGKHDFDQEINVYLAGLLYSLMESGAFSQQKPYISPFDADVRGWLESHPGLRNEYQVYRDNADVSLILLGLFLGHEHHGSYQHIVLSGADEQGRVALYYELAASALAHLHGHTVSLVSVFSALADTMPEILQILRRAAGFYFDLLERLTEGSLYHLDHELDALAQKENYNKLLDEFLGKYAAYKEKPSEELRQAVLDLSEKLHKLNSEFNFSAAFLKS